MHIRAFIADLSAQKLTPRCVLLPGEQARYRVIFKPKDVGNYSHKYTIEAVGWPIKYYLYCEGASDIPKIDVEPEALFCKTIEKRNKKNMFDPLVFVKELDVFDFGYILLCNTDVENDEATKTELHLNNVSLLPCHLSFSLRYGSKHFDFDPRSLTIESGGMGVLYLYALPNKKATFADELLISMKNNPITRSVKLSCTGCKIKFNVNPKSVEFQRVTISQKEQRKISLQNESNVPCTWKFEGLEEFLDRFVVSDLGGVLKPLETKEVCFEFVSDEVMTFPKAKFKILVSFLISHLIFHSFCSVRFTISTKFAKMLYTKKQSNCSLKQLR